MNKVGVVLSGCGHQDGSEIHEAVFTLHALEKAGAEAIIMAPDMDQFHVINHLNGNEDLTESRNILVESARIARGKVVDVASVSGHQLDALIFPGGTGMAKNIFDYSMAGINCTVISDVQRLVVEILEADKPLGAICIAPVMVAKVLEFLGRTGTVTGGFNVEINNDIKKNVYNPESLNVVYAGQISTQKGVDKLLEVWDEFQSNKLVLNIIGPLVNKEIIKNKKFKNVNFLGEKNNEETLKTI